jgi:hypothetical protein
MYKAELFIEGNQGRQFVFAFPESHDSSSDLSLDVAARETSIIHVEAPELGLNSNYTVQKGTRTFSLNNRIELRGSGIWKKGIHIISDRDIRIYATSQNKLASSDGFLVLPYTSLSTSYFVASYTPLQSSEFAIAAAYDSTSVTITFRIPSGVVTFLGRHYSNGQKTTITLHKLDVAHIQHVHDLTGTYVESDKPISVVSGNKCADVPKSVTACDVLLEFMPPLSTWGNQYISAAFKTRLHNRVRVISGSDGNTVKLGNLKVITLNRGQFYEQTFTQDDAVLIDCSNPCLLVQYAEGTSADGQTGDPSMTIVPSLDHFDNDFYFKTPNVVNNYLSIIIHSSDVTGLRLDGRSLSGEERTVLVTDLQSEVNISL